MKSVDSFETREGLLKNADQGLGLAVDINQTDDSNDNNEASLLEH